MRGSVSDNEEKQLLINLGAGDEKAFEKIYKLYSNRLLNNLIRLVKTEQFVQEILQDVFISLWNNRENINPDKSFQSYLFRIAENKAFDFFRKAAVEKKRTAQLMTHILTSNSEPSEADFQSEVYYNMLDKAISTLPDQRQRVYRLCKLEGKSYKEVNAALGISLSTISDHVVKANKAVRDYIMYMDEVIIISLLIGCITR